MHEMMSITNIDLPRAKETHVFSSSAKGLTMRNLRIGRLDALDLLSTKKIAMTE